MAHGERITPERDCAVHAKMTHGWTIEGLVSSVPPTGGRCVDVSSGLAAPAADLLPKRSGRYGARGSLGRSARSSHDADLVPVVDGKSRNILAKIPDSGLRRVDGMQRTYDRATHDG